MMRGKALVSAVSLLVLGAVLGIAADRHFHRPMPHPVGAAAQHRAVLEAMQKELHLHEDQVQAINGVMREHQVFLQGAWADLHLQLSAVLDTVHQEIEAVLTPEQQVAFRRWAAEVAGMDPHATGETGLPLTPH
ncbi:MAG: hypothetical protein R3E10_16065 [Gemmatimonadota bacterium]